MKPPALSLFAPYLCKPRHSGCHVCVSRCVCPPISASFTFVSYCLMTTSPSFSLNSIAVLPFHLLSSVFLSPAALSLKVSFTPSSAVPSLFGNWLPPGQKLCSSLCLPIRLHLCSPPSIFLLYPLAFTRSDNRFQDPSIENSHLHWLPLSSLLSSYHQWSFVLTLLFRGSRGGDGEGKKENSKEHCHHTFTQRLGQRERI